MKNKPLFIVGILGATAVILGAFAAHFLKGKVNEGLMTPDQLEGFEKGVKYQMYHSLALLMLTLLREKISNFKLIYLLFVSGIIFFSGSLYFLCTRNIMGAEWLRFLGPVTPLGGLCFIAAWLILAISGLKNNKTTA